jgi:hypothetical protein
MAEEKQEKKKGGLCWRILKWIGLAALSVLIILGLIFEAPWKVIALLLIVLAACRILPKAYRKWFWVGVGVVVLALIIWVLLPEKEGDWRPYTFDEELAALEAKRAIPDEENAATIYNQLLETYDENAFEPNLTDPNVYYLTSSEPWLSEDYPELAEWLKGHQSTMATLMKASKIEKCRFPIVADPFDMTRQMDRLSSMRQWMRLLISSGNNDYGEGRIEVALEKYMCVLGMAKHLCQQSAMIEILSGIANEAPAIRQFKRFVVNGDATEEQLSVIEEALRGIKHEWSYDLPKFIEHDKLMNKGILSMSYEINSKGKTRFSRNPWEKMKVWLKEELNAERTEDKEAIELLKSRLYPAYWLRKRIKAETILSWFFMPSTPQRAAEIIDAAFDKYYEMAEPDFDWQQKVQPPLSILTQFNFSRIRFNFKYFAKLTADMSEGSYYGVHDNYIRLMMGKRGSRLLIGLRRYRNKTGRWPESLDDIKSLAPAEIFVDPINGGSFVYKLTDDGFKLYSKGKNNIDEDGQYNSVWDPNTYKHRVEEDDTLIWPQKTYKTQKRNSDSE